MILPILTEIILFYVEIPTSLMVVGLIVTILALTFLCMESKNARRINEPTNFFKSCIILH